jgi:hypothetical protein
MYRPRPLLPLVACSAAALVAGCRTDDDFAPPTPPDMGALVEAYTRPTGRLNPTTAVEAAQGIAARADDLKKSLVLAKSVFEAVNDIGGAGPSGTTTASEGLVSSRAQALTGSVELWQEVRWACYGPEGPDAAVDPQWGRIVLNTLADKAGLDPVAWGGFERCVMPSSAGFAQVIDGALNVHIPWGAATGAPFIFDFDGSWLDDTGQAVEARIAFGVLDRAVALLQETSTGSLRVEVTFEAIEDLLAGGGLRLTDADGAWTCSVGPGLEGGACTLDGRRVSW